MTYLLGKKPRPPFELPPIRLPPFASKHDACEAGYSVKPMQAGDYAVFARGIRTEMRGNSERGAWALLLGAK
jgi:hypothetical protein